jgi:hypothetical protein
MFTELKQLRETASFSSKIDENGLNEANISKAKLENQPSTNNVYLMRGSFEWKVL